MNKFCFFVGPGKTGSSALQLWLSENTEKLREQGVYYPKHKTDANGVSSGNLYRVLEKTESGKLDASPKLIEKLLVDFERSGTHTLLLSSEFFFPAIEQLDHLLPGAEFLAYLRDPLEAFESETVTAYEVGFKSTLADGNVQLNGSAFLYDYEDIQTFVPSSLGFRLANLEEADITGLSWRYWLL